MSETVKWSYSHDGEIYHGEFNSWQDAAEEGLSDGEESCWVGEQREPIQPEAFVDAEVLIEHVISQEEYLFEWCEDWPGSTKEQEDELTAELKKVFASWLDKHGLRPTWFMIENERRVTRQELDAGIVATEEAPAQQIIHVKTVYRFDNGNCAVLGFEGQQIPELQRSWEESKELLKAPHVDLSRAEWPGVPFDERMEIEATKCPKKTNP